MSGLHRLTKAGLCSAWKGLICGNLHPLGNHEILKKWIVCNFEKMTLAYFRHILKNGMFFQNSLKKDPIPAAPPRPPGQRPPAAPGGGRGRRG